MNTRNLPGVILTFLFVGLLVSVGAILFYNIGLAGSEQITVTAENHTFTTGSEVTLDNADIKEVTLVSNRTTTLADTDYYVDLELGKLMISDATIASGTGAFQYNVSYVYYADSTAKTAMFDTRTATTTLTSTWVALMITVIVLAIILGLVVKSFSNTGR